ncbi:pyruvate dehydrogenase (acetyl-transferring) kinase, mitochondrial [Tanacetum coccineum]
MAETMEQFVSKTRADYGSGIARPKIDDKDSFEQKANFSRKYVTTPSMVRIMKTLTNTLRKSLRLTRSTETSDALEAIQAQLNNLGRKIKKVNEKVYAAQVGCEQSKGPHYTNDCPLKEEGKTLEEAYYTQFGRPFQGVGYRAEALGFYQRNNANLSYQERRQSMEETPRKFMRALIKPLDIQIGQISKVLQEIGFGSLPSSTKDNLRDHVKLISTNVEADSNPIRHLIILDMPEDVKVPLILGRPFLSTAHAKIDVFKRKITLRVGDEKIIFKSIKPTSSLIKRVYMLSLRERVELDLEARLMGETLVLNRSLDPLYGDYIELNDLNVPLELKRDQVDDLMPTIKEGKVTDKPMIDIIRTRNNESFDEDFYNSIIKDKVEYKGKNIVGAFMNVPIFVRNFSVVTHFEVVENMDCYRDQDMGDIILKEPFYKASCVEARSFAGLITIHNGSDNDLAGKEIDGVGEVSIIWNPMCVVVMLVVHDKEVRDNTFSSLDHEDANEHIEKFLEIIDLFHIPNITQDQVMLRAFAISLSRAASRWLKNKPSGSLITWEDLKTMFLSKYFLPARTAKKMEEINNFQQEPDETLYQACERFKELLMKCPQHYLSEMQEESKVIIFYNGLGSFNRQIIGFRKVPFHLKTDADAKSTPIPSKTAADAKVAIQEMAEYSQKWHNGTFRTRSTKTSDGLAAIQAQLNNLGREI